MSYFKLNKTSLYFLIFSVSLLKFFIYIYFKSSNQGLGLGGGNDASYYHAYAIGVTDIAVNVWPVILRFMSDIGLYNRNLISFILFLSTLTVIPYLLYRTVIYKEYNDKVKVFLYVYFISSTYPTLYLFS